jgi:hypothetical protein
MAVRAKHVRWNLHHRTLLIQDLHTPVEFCYVLLLANLAKLVFWLSWLRASKGFSHSSPLIAMQWFSCVLSHQKGIAHIQMSLDYLIVFGPQQHLKPLLHSYASFQFKKGRYFYVSNIVPNYIPIIGKTST